jgi:hypothetical protein
MADGGPLHVRLASSRSRLKANAQNEARAHRRDKSDARSEPPSPKDGG